MIRETEIRNAIDTIFPIHPSDNGREYEQALMATGFEAGVKWADENPKSPWISVEDDLPCNHSELISSEKSSTNLKVTVDVVAVIHNFIIMSKMFEMDGEWHWYNDKPTHWFPIPQPPKEG